MIDPGEEWADRREREPINPRDLLPAMVAATALLCIGGVAIILVSIGLLHLYGFLR